MRLPPKYAKNTMSLWARPIITSDHLKDDSVFRNDPPFSFAAMTAVEIDDSAIGRAAKFVLATISDASNNTKSVLRSASADSHRELYQRILRDIEKGVREGRGGQSVNYT